MIIRLAEADLERLDNLAEKRGATRSKIMREALDRYLLLAAEFEQEYEEAPRAS